MQEMQSGSLVARHRKESSVRKQTMREAARGGTRVAISWRAARRAGASAAQTHTGAPGCSTSCSKAPPSLSASPPVVRLEIIRH